MLVVENKYNQIKKSITYKNQSINYLDIYYYMSNSNDYTDLKTVYEYMMMIIPDTVECERNFSKMNLIKCDLRNRTFELFNTSNVLIVY